MYVCKHSYSHQQVEKGPDVIASISGGQTPIGVPVWADFPAPAFPFFPSFSPGAQQTTGIYYCSQGFFAEAAAGAGAAVPAGA